MSMNVNSLIGPWRGVVLDIHTAPTGGAPMVATDAVSAVAGLGIEGDRYYEGTGFYSWFTGPIRHISLIEWEVLEALRDSHNLPLEPGITRRNIVTRGVPLGHLLNREFRVGEATLRGVEICEPCKHLVDLTGTRALLSALIHRGGLHAEIVGSGTIRPGDTIEAIEPQHIRVEAGSNGKAAVAGQFSPLAAPRGHPPAHLLAHPLKRLSLRCGSQVSGERSNAACRVQVAQCKTAEAGRPSRPV